MKSNAGPGVNQEQEERDENAACHTLILGIGNTLRKDDGVGITVIDRLRDHELPSGVGLLDGGTAGIDLLSYLEDLDRLIIVDALYAEGNPGEIKVIAGDELKERDIFLSGHYGRLSDMLDMVGALGKRPVTTIIGIIPLDCESYEMGLSPEVEKAVPGVIEMICALLAGQSKAIL